ncbi:hypothetical protein HOH87_00290 [bacterium]|jgi:DNA transformation protein and related proteins|nr:hypothetical protein [bacterium]
MTPIEYCPNLGPRSVECLHELGIYTIEELRDYTIEKAYLDIKAQFRRVSLNFLYAMAAGLQDRHILDLTPKEKDVIRGRLP